MRQGVKMSGLFDSTISLIEQTLNLRSFKHKVLSSNIANLETPGYRARDVKFADELKKIGGGSMAGGLVNTHPGHIGTSSGNSVNPEVTYVSTEAKALDGNTVSVDAEMVKLSENTMMYSLSAKLIKAKFRTLMAAIKG
jgi:flagellar basal-body rod protein FlgB